MNQNGPVIELFSRSIHRNDAVPQSPSSSSEKMAYILSDAFSIPDMNGDLIMRFISFHSVGSVLFLSNFVSVYDDPLYML